MGQATEVAWEQTAAAFQLIDSEEDGQAPDKSGGAGALGFGAGHAGEVR